MTERGTFPNTDGRRMTIFFTRENIRYIQEWRTQFEYTIGQPISFEVAVNALVGFMKQQRDETLAEMAKKEKLA